MAALTPRYGAFPRRPEEAAVLLTWPKSPENSQMPDQVVLADGGYAVQLPKDRAAWAQILSALRTIRVKSE